MIFMIFGLAKKTPPFFFSYEKFESGMFVCPKHAPLKTPVGKILDSCGTALDLEKIQKKLRKKNDYRNKCITKIT